MQSLERVGPSNSSLIMRHSIPAAPSHPPPPPATAGNLPAFSVPGVGYLQILRCPLPPPPPPPHKFSDGPSLNKGCDVPGNRPGSQRSHYESFSSVPRSLFALFESPEEAWNRVLYMYSPRNEPDPEMVFNPEIIPKSTPK